MTTLLILLAVANAPVAGIEVEHEHATRETSALTAEPLSETLHLDQHDRQRFTLACNAPQDGANLEVSWRAVSLDTGGNVTDHSSSDNVGIQDAWELTFVTTGAHVVEAVCYAPATEWTSWARWVVYVEPGVQRVAVRVQARDGHLWLQQAS